jgi:hypothetical protein
MRVNRGQELVIAGYTPYSKNFHMYIIKVPPMTAK